MRNLLPALLLPLATHAQIDWKNYSTSFQGDGKEGTRPTLVTAIPYNGRYENASYGSIPAARLPLTDSLRNGSGQWPRYVGKALTYDSGEVYFLAPGTHAANAGRYEFRVISDSNRSILPWSPITRFTHNGVGLNDFKENFGFLGGYKADWGHSILVDIRERATKVILSSCIVYWQADWPTIRGIYTASNLPDLIGNKGNFGDWKTDSAMKHRLGQLHKGSLTLRPGDNTLILYLGANIYRDTALEYQLARDGSVITTWRPKMFNNDMLLLQDLRPGAYTLQLRLRAQRHNVSTCHFTIRPAWYETSLFRFAIITLLVIAATAVILLLTLVRQRRKTRRERAAREKTTLELRAIRSQLNPHFIFNALSSIQGLVNKEDTNAANHYLSEFGNLLRDSLAISDNNLTELQREITLLDTYLKLEKLRFGFRYTIEIAPDVPMAATGIPAFLLQPLVENAVRHGVASLHDQGLIHLFFFRQNTTFIARVTDNGPGWNPAAPAAGYGLKLTQERIRLLNQLLKIRIVLVLPYGGAAKTTIELQFSNWWT